MERYFDSDQSVSADHKEQAGQIKVCRLLIERILANDYTSPFDRRNEEFWVKFSDAFDICMYEEKTLIYSKTELEKKLVDAETEHKGKMLEQDIELLFKIMNKHVQNWWD
jgi:hypothetical protein